MESQNQPDQIQILIAMYPNLQTAENALRALMDAKRNQGVQVTDAVVVRLDEHKRLHIHETEDVTAGRGAAVGGVLGGILGIIAGPGGVVLGAAVGAVVGGAAAGIVDTGIPHDRLTEIGRSLNSGNVALVVLTDAGSRTFIESVISPGSATIHAEAADAEAARKLGHDHDVALKALTLGDSLAVGGMASPEKE